MTPRQTRMLGALIVIAGVGAAVAFSLRAFQENLLYFYTPAQALEARPPAGKQFRLGGMVLKGSVQRRPGDIEMRFEVTDNQREMTVVYAGVLPDLFREGQGVIVKGSLNSAGVFVADEVLAKHDENYMPPDVAATLASQGHPSTTPMSSSTVSQ